MTSEGKRFSLEIWSGRIFIGLVLFGFLYICFVKILDKPLLEKALARAIATEIIERFDEQGCKNNYFIKD